MAKQSIYLISAIVVGILFVIFLIILLKKKRIISLQKQVQELERQRNLIVSTPIASELAKVDVIIKNDKLESKYESWQERYRVIKENRFQVITDMLLEIDGLIESNDIKTAKQKIMELEMEIYKLRVSTDNLLDEIREVTMSEERNRAIVTKLKSKFRDLERTFITNQSSYGDIDKFIELQFENIEKRFQEFETIMENNDYSEIVSSVKVLDEMIAHISTVIEEVPDLLLLTNKIIPSRIAEIKDTYNYLLSKNYPLSYLNVEYNIDKIEKSIKEILDRVKILNLEDSMLELKTYLDYLDNLLNDFEIEKRSKKIFDEEARTFKNKISKINKIVSDIYEQLNDIKNMYNLSEDDLQELENVDKNLYEINKSYNVIVGDLKSKKEPYSSLKEKIESLSNKLSTTENDLDICLKSLGSMQEDEQRAREQLKEITNLLSKCKTNIRNYPLPIINSNYFVELSEANDAIGEIVKELEKTPITIKTLNIRVDTARDLSLKLFNTTTEMIKTAKLAEMIIVYGNRYKPLDKDIERGLDMASNLFFKGNYKESLETSIATINIVEPDIYNKMLNIYKN